MKKKWRIVLLLWFIPALLAAQADGVFPAEPFMGMQVSYAITGARVTKQQDAPGFTWTRNLVLSRLQPEEKLGVSGLLQGGGIGCTVIVLVSAGSHTNHMIYQLKPGQPQEFNVSVTVPSDARAASVIIEMTGHYGTGSVRGVSVQGEWDGRWGNPQKQVQPEMVRPVAQQ